MHRSMYQILLVIHILKGQVFLLSLVRSSLWILLLPSTYSVIFLFLNIINPCIGGILNIFPDERMGQVDREAMENITYGS